MAGHSGRAEGIGGSLDLPTAKYGRVVLRYVRTFVDVIDYADGMYWHATRPFVTTPFESLVAAPTVARRGEVGARGRYRPGLDRLSEGAIAIQNEHLFMYGFRMQECVSFENVSDKTVASFQSTSRS